MRAGTGWMSQTRPSAAIARIVYQVRSYSHVNDERVVDSHLLHDGDRIRVGGTELVFVLDS